MTLVCDAFGGKQNKKKQSLNECHFCKKASKNSTTNTNLICIVIQESHLLVLLGRDRVVSLMIPLQCYEMELSGTRSNFERLIDLFYTPNLPAPLQIQTYRGL